MERISVTISVEAPPEKVWEYFTSPKHIMAWNFASDDWCCPRATNDLRAGGHFSSRMEAKDGSAGFDFEGTYEEVVPCVRIAYVFGDRKATVTFSAVGKKTEVTTIFDPETENPREMQRAGWQAILDTFKEYCESSGNEDWL